MLEKLRGFWIINFLIGLVGVGAGGGPRSKPLFSHPKWPIFWTPKKGSFWVWKQRFWTWRPLHTHQTNFKIYYSETTEFFQDFEDFFSAVAPKPQKLEQKAPGPCARSQISGLSGATLSSSQYHTHLLSVVLPFWFWEILDLVLGKTFVQWIDLGEKRVFRSPNNPQNHPLIMEHILRGLRKIWDFCVLSVVYHPQSYFSGHW